MVLLKITRLEIILLNVCLLSAAHQPSIEAPHLNEKATAESPFISLICLQEAKEGPDQAGGGGRAWDEHGKGSDILGKFMPCSYWL